MTGTLRVFQRRKIEFACIIAFQVLLFGAPQELPHEPGFVYYADGPDFKSLEKEAAPASGHAHFSAKMKGPHAAVRLGAAQVQKFRVCSVDPTRYKLYRFRSTKNSREVTIQKVNIWIGGAKTVLSEAEIPVTVQTADAGCFTITTKEQLEYGEYGISPMGDEYAFTFGVGEVKPHK